MTYVTIHEPKMKLYSGVAEGLSDIEFENLEKTLLEDDEIQQLNPLQFSQLVNEIKHEAGHFKAASNLKNKHGGRKNKTDVQILLYRCAEILAHIVSDGTNTRSAPLWEKENGVDIDPHKRAKHESLCVRLAKTIIFVTSNRKPSNLRDQIKKAKKICKPQKCSDSHP